MATMKQIAQLAKVSVSTVSIVLRGEAEERKIPEITCRKVYDAAAKLNYQPNIEARALRDQSAVGATVVALYWAQNFRASMMIRFLQGMRKRLSDLGESVRLVVVPYNNDELCRDSRLQGKSSYHAAIVCNASDADMKFLHEKKLDIPIVLYNRKSTLYDSVSTDNEEIGRKAAEIFARHGRKRAAILRGKNVFRNLDSRFLGFLDVFAERGLELEGILQTDGTYAAGESGLEKLLITERRPDCLFCLTDALGIGALRTLHKRKIRVPEQMEIIAVGNGDIQQDAAAWPSLSTVQIPMEEIADRCLELLLERVSHPMGKLKEEQIASRYIPRESCGA